MRKIPPDAVDYYFSLGPGRSYRTVAEHYGVSKRAVTNLAKREDWQQRLLKLEDEARERADKKNEDELVAAIDRHLKAIRLVFGKGVEGLRNMTIDTPADAMKAIALAIREERVALGEPSDRTAVTVEDTIKREYERWMVVDGTAKRRGGDELDNDEKIG